MTQAQFGCKFIRVSVRTLQRGRNCLNINSCVFTALTPLVYVHEHRLSLSVSSPEFCSHFAARTRRLDCSQLRVRPFTPKIRHLGTLYDHFWVPSQKLWRTSFCVRNIVPGMASLQGKFFRRSRGHDQKFSKSGWCGLVTRQTSK